MIKDNCNIPVKCDGCGLLVAWAGTAIISVDHYIYCNDCKER